MSVQKSNPFSDEYVKKEVEFYNLADYANDVIKIKTTELFGRCDDFLNVRMRLGGLFCPQFFINNRLWMSITPMEIQSQYIPIKQAHGNVAVGGLGMGYYLLRIMAKDNIDSIDIYEIEEKAITFFKKNFRYRKGFDKVNFILGDVRKLMKDKTYDYAYIDVYPDMLPEEVITDKELLTMNNQIDTYHFWCQEKIFMQANEKGLLSLSDIDDDVQDLFKMWSKSKGAKLRDHELDQSFIETCLDLFDL